MELIEYITDERDVYARAFVNVMESHGGLVPFLHKLIAGDVSRNKDEATLFRGNSICTASIEYYFRLIGGDYLRNTLSTFIAKIKREKKETDVSLSFSPNAHLVVCYSEESGRLHPGLEDHGVVRRRAG